MELQINDKAVEVTLNLPLEIRGTLISELENYVEKEAISKLERCYKFKLIVKVNKDKHVIYQTLEGTKEPLNSTIVVDECHMIMGNTVRVNLSNIGKTKYITDCINFMKYMGITCIEDNEGTCNENN
ncbi:hypothetical protein UT300012_21890 [Paraclostridium bifermentans]